MKKRLILSVLLGASSLSSAAMANTQINTNALQACSLIENDLRRLLCYDNVVAGKAATSQASSVEAASQARTQASTVPATAAVATGGVVASQTTQSADKSEFGLEHKQTEQHDEDALQATVTNVDKAPRGELVLTLDNGQTWRQIGTDRFNVSKNEQVTISRAMFNSFLLKKADANKTIRVKRIN